MTETVIDNPAADFATLMNKAAEAVSGPAEEAPYGWTTDKDGNRRPKKTPGRPRKPPALEELKETAAAAAPEAAAEDRAPASGKPARGRRGPAEPPGDKKPVVQFREGVIAKGMNRLYRKAGKLVKVADADIGQALIDITRKDTLADGTPDPEDITVGEAWEEIARTNPRIRAFLTKMIAGGAWGQLFMCHAPAALAIIMKDAIRKRLPFAKLMEAFLTPDEDGQAPADGTPAEGLQPGDMQQMMAMARQFATQVMERGAPAATPRPPEATVFHVNPDGETGEVMTVPPGPGPAGPGATIAMLAANGR